MSLTEAAKGAATDRREEKRCGGDQRGGDGPKVASSNIMPRFPLFSIPFVVPAA
jgi:hypothetical protein